MAAGEKGGESSRDPQDAIEIGVQHGTDVLITLDFDSLEDQAVTIRERDTMTQERVAISEVSNYLAVRLKGA